MNPTSFFSIGTAAYAGVVALGPLTLLCALIVSSARANRLGRSLAEAAARVALGVFFLALGAAFLCSKTGPLQFAGPGVGPVRLDIYFDTLSAVMLLLVSFLGAVVVRYSVNYLAGDARQGIFIKWLCITLGFVLTLVICGNLLLFTLAWVATSLSLHRLLTFYPDRPAAMLAARKKFLISRLGDACMLGALMLTWHGFGTWNFSAIFAALEATRAQSGSLCLNATGALLVGGALLKSAQFPFHSWLPDTMETPTPVSALMHAGIINAGGFLVVRLSPLIAAVPMALNALALVGAFTALFASVVMLTQTSVKRSLAYSTIAQMGFMMLQCGLGAFSLAVLHLVAHSLYKAHAFLSSGSIVRMHKAAWVPVNRPAAHPFILTVTLLVSVAVTWAIGWAFGWNIQSGAGVLLLGAVFMMAQAYLLWNLWASSHRGGLVGGGLLLSAATAGAYFGLHAIFETLLASSLIHYAPQPSALQYAMMLLVLLLFMGVLVFQSQLPGWPATRLGRALYVHASHGFYVGTIANRFTLRFAGKSTL